MKKLILDVNRNRTSWIITDTESVHAGEARAVCFDFGASKFQFGRGHIEDLHTWLGQWLKENPEKVEGWLNVYPSGVGNNIQDTKDEANRLGHNPRGEECRVACILISYHKGEGLTTEEPGE